MNTDFENLKTPGQLIDALLAQRGWTKRTLGIVLDIAEQKISRLTSGKQAVSAEMAVLLEEVFGISADRFLSLQADYELAKARITAVADPNRSTRATLYGDLPVSEMIKRGWLDVDSVKDTDKVQSELMSFFKVNRLDDIEVLPHAAKKTDVNQKVTPAQLAWLYRVKTIAEELLVAKFIKQSVDKAIAQLDQLLFSIDEIRKVPKILAQNGIRFAIVETLPSAKIDGVCFWLNEKSPVVAITTRHNRIDNFWFVLRHELEHVRLGHGLSHIMLDVELEGEKAGQSPEIEEEERAANIAAAEFCVPQNKMDKFIQKKEPFFAERDLLGFARSIKVHPGLIAGQLQFRTKDYRRFRNHLTPIRSILAPNAAVDGWGNPYPIEKG